MNQLRLHESIHSEFNHYEAKLKKIVIGSYWFEPLANQCGDEVNQLRLHEPIHSELNHYEAKTQKNKIHTGSNSSANQYRDEMNQLRLHEPSHFESNHYESKLKKKIMDYEVNKILPNTKDFKKDTKMTTEVIKKWDKIEIQL